MKKRSLFSYSLFIIIILFFSYLMLEITWPFTSFKNNIGFLLSKQHVWHLFVWRIAFYTHIFCSLPLLLLGALQVIPIIRKKQVKLHRRLGQLYAAIILFLAAPSGLILGIYANGGILAQISFSLLASLWWVFTFLGWRQMRIGNEVKHRNNMIRSYALTLSAIALRTYVFIIPAFFAIRGKEMYVFVAWASWLPNLLIAQLFIYYLNKKKS